MQYISGCLPIEKIQFADCILDPAFQTLTTSSRVRRLRGKLFFVLCNLVNNQNQLVTREKLIDECWNGNSFTGEKAVTHTICQLRKILKELNIPMSITTLSKQGYVFTQIEFIPFEHSRSSALNKCP
ncbi:MAG: helix-turn-helix domain-containing protein [Kangiellaceae bacterium]|nr:helix-turn-helix domain-containing protein [Kangiellaceae bacterium]